MNHRQGNRIISNNFNSYTISKISQNRLRKIISFLDKMLNYSQCGFVTLLTEKEADEPIFDEKIDTRLENLDVMLTTQYKEMRSMEDFIEEILDRRKEKMEKGESLTRPSVTSEHDMGESSRSRPRSHKPRPSKSKSISPR